MSCDVFISYSSDDKEVAQIICETLEKNGLTCWIAPRNIVVGSYGAAIIKAIKESKMMVLVLSSNANRSEHVHREVERAADKGITIYPVRIEDVLPSEDLELFISSEQWLDAFTSPIETHLEQLTENVKVLLGNQGDHRLPQSQRSSWLNKPRHVTQPWWVLLALGGLILLLIGWIWFKSDGDDPANRVNVNAGSPLPLAEVTHTPTPETKSTQQPGPTPVLTPLPIAVVPSPTTEVTPTPTESLAGTLWEYQTGSVKYIWDFQPNGLFRSRRPEKGTYLPDGTWEQIGDTVIIRTSIKTDNPETYKGKIRGDRMTGTFTALRVYRWSATKMTP